MANKKTWVFKIDHKKVNLGPIDFIFGVQMSRSHLCAYDRIVISNNRLELIISI